MNAATTNVLRDIVGKYEHELLAEWLQHQQATSRRASDGELREQSRTFLSLFAATLAKGGDHTVDSPAWGDVRDLLASISKSRAREGLTPSETASFVLALKQPLFARLRRELRDDVAAFAENAWSSAALLDELALYTTEVYQKGREEVISRQQQEMLELSTPVVQLWEGILALPVIGTLDSERTQVVMESLLQKIVDTGAGIAIIDITGVPTVDTLVAQHLLKTVAAARLMGAECIISGIRPQIAQTIVHLGVELQGVITKATLADAFAVALRRGGLDGRAHAAGELTADAMERIPILKMGDCLLVTIQVDMHDRLAMTLQDDLTTKIAATRARGVLIDISALEIVDSFIGRMLGNIAAMARVLDARTVVVGMRPAVAITLVELGLSLPGVRTALNVEKGMEMIRAALAAPAGDDGRSET